MIFDDPANFYEESVTFAMASITARLRTLAGHYVSPIAKNIKEPEKVNNCMKILICWFIKAALPMR